MKQHSPASGPWINSAAVRDALGPGLQVASSLDRVLSTIARPTDR
ncbi:MAG: hypothetical protein AAF467_27090 [Actinomycetota bacterium]